MSAQEALVRYRIDAAMSRLTVRVFPSGLLAAMGHSPTIAVHEYSGEAGFVPENLDQAFVRVTAKAESLVVADDIGSKDKLEIENKMKEEVLEVDRYPEITFESSSISSTKMSESSYGVNITGSLTLHGVTRSQRMIFQVALNDETVRAFGEFSLRQTDYGINLVSVAGGALKVKDEVKCSFDMVARKQA